ncbi:MAG TPA: copper resistance protein CopC [Chloroflexota bacterium]
MIRSFIAIGAALVGLVVSSCAPLLAGPPHLVASWPVEGARLSVARHTLDLIFNRPLNPDATTANVWRQDDGAPLATRLMFDPDNARRLQVRLLEPARGAYEIHWHAVEAASGQPEDGDLSFELQDESPAPPRIDVSPWTADAGDRLELVGKGFARQSTVQLFIGDDDQVLKSVETDARGSINVELRVPASVPFGIQPLSAVDSTGRKAITALQVRWGGWPPLVATSQGQPGPDAGEVTFTLKVRNRSDYLLEHVRMVMRDPDGAALVAADPSAHREAGTLVWDLPVMDRGVVGPFRATYRTAAAVVSHTWLEFRHRRAGGCTADACLPAFISNSVADSTQVAPMAQAEGARLARRGGDLE